MPLRLAALGRIGLVRVFSLDLADALIERLLLGHVNLPLVELKTLLRLVLLFNFPELVQLLLDHVLLLFVFTDKLLYSVVFVADDFRQVLYLLFLFSFGLQLAFILFPVGVILIRLFLQLLLILFIATLG